MSAAWGTRAWFEREFRAAGAEADPWGHEWRASQKVRHERLARSLKPLLAQGGRTALDMGCAFGALTARLVRLNPGGRVVGLDLSQWAARVARGRVPGAAFVVGALPDCPLAAETFDVILAAETLYYLPEAGRAASVAELWRILRPGGRMVFSTVLDDGSRYFTAAGAQALVSGCFRVEQIEFGYDRWMARWETPWLDLERRLSRAARVLLDEAEFAAWQAEHAVSRAGASLRRLRGLRLGRSVALSGLHVGRALVRWLLGWRWPVFLLAFLGRRLGAGPSEIVIVASRI